MSLYQVPENIKTANDLTAKLEHLKNIKRSFSVYRIDCGSCNGCEIEIFAAITPMWDPEQIRQFFRRATHRVLHGSNSDG